MRVTKKLLSLVATSVVALAAGCAMEASEPVGQWQPDHSER